MLRIFSLASFDNNNYIRLIDTPSNPLITYTMTTPSQLTAITIVPTKQYDGGRSSSSFEKKRRLHSSRENDYDAFLHYSRQDVRMNALLGHGVSKVENDEVNCHVRRQTRISFELHDSLVMMDSMQLSLSSS